MYELHNGTLKWSALDREEKRLATIALAAGSVPAVLLLLPIAEQGFHFGRWIRGGDAALAISTGLDGLRASPWFGAFVLAAMLGGLVSALAWWRFSLRQDEMFHRVQGFVLARMGGCAIAAGLFWWMASLPGWVEQVSLEGLVYGGLLLFALFSADAWRRWG